jgi:hypothetical protein
MKIELSRASGACAIIDDSDFLSVSRHTWWLNTKGYAYTTIAKKTVFMHRLIFYPGEGLMVDHINRDKLDNRRANLRSSTHAQNIANLLRRTKSGFKGVCIDVRVGGYRYRARVYSAGKVYPGPFRTDAASAARDYDLIAREVHGEFAFQNFPVAA